MRRRHTTRKGSRFVKEVTVSRVQTRRRIRATLAELELAQFGADPAERERLRELLELGNAQLTDDAATNDRQRFAGMRTLSFDELTSAGYEPQAIQRPSLATREEREALEVAMRPFFDALGMEHRDALSHIHRYQFSWRDAARRLRIKVPRLQRRVRRALEALRMKLAERYFVRIEKDCSDECLLHPKVDARVA